MKSTDVVDIYHQNYFLNAVDGYREFLNFDGTEGTLFDRYKRNIDALDLKPSENFLEIGCGRGEIVMYHAKSGGYSMGVDYSSDAIALAIQKRNELGLDCFFLESSFSNIPEDKLWDKILASEFIEHISKEEGKVFFEKAYKILKPDGRLVVFTHPNTLQRKYGYPILRLYNFILKGKRLPVTQDDTQNEHYKKYHLNEQNIFSLKKFALSAGFRVKRIDYDNSRLKKSLLSLIVKSTPLKHLFCTNLLLIAEK